MDKPEVPQDKIINKINSSINNESYDNPFPCYKEGIFPTKYKHN
jgi:hypothetical protein